MRAPATPPTTLPTMIAVLLLDPLSEGGAAFGSTGIGGLPDGVGGATGVGSSPGRGGATPGGGGAIGGDGERTR